MNNKRLVIPIIAWGSLFAASSGHGQDEINAAAPVEVTVEKLGEFTCIDEGEHRLGVTDRMFLIEDQWELDRCARLIKELPSIDFANESLLVVMSWQLQSRSIQKVQADGDQLVINVRQQPPPEIYAGSYHPPKFLVARLPAWPGPVQFEVNGHRQYTVLRGEAQAKQVEELWEEILRIHSGGPHFYESSLASSATTF